MSHAFHAQKRKEKFFKLAKEQGYRSRAAFKLIQLNKKYNFLETSRACLDLCAAPGGWLQICSKYMPVNSMIIGVDILPIKPLPNVTTFIEDITTPACRQTLKKQLHGWQVDLVLHDGAPSVGGGAAWAKDAYLQTELVLHSLKLASEFLVEGGTFVSKVFRSPDYMALTWVLKQFFRKVEVTKPIASRQASSEVFAVCQGYLAPKKIDPRLFDPAVVFKHSGVTEATDNKVLNVLTRKEPKRPSRGGYDDDIGQLVFKKATVSQYVNTANPSEILGSFNEIVFDEEAEVYRSHSATTSEVLELIKDLKVLGKGDFAQLIKWHKKLVQYKAELLEAAAGDDAEEEMVDNEEEAVVEEVDVEELRVQEAEEMAQKMQDKQRKDKKKKHEAKMKEIKRLALNAHNLMEQNTANDDDLFALSRTQNDAVLQSLRKADDVVETIGADKFAQIISTNADEYYSDVSASEEDYDDDDVDYETARERSIDALYEEYKKRKGIVTKTDKKKTAKAILAETKNFVDNDVEDDTDDEMDALQRAKEQASSTKNKLSMLKEEKEEDTVVAQRWFGQDAFAEINIDDEQEVNMRKQLEATDRKRRRAETVEQSDSEGDDEYDYDALNTDDEDSDSDSEDEKDQRGRWLSTKKELDEDKARKAAIQAKAEKFAATKQGMHGQVEQEGFEEVALSEFSDDSDARAEILALGTKMLRKKSRNAIIDAAYNRYAFHDTEELPSWFIEDENLHNKPQLPITKAEVMTFKQELKAINSRPIRRLAEAVARKKKGALRKLERAKVQANAISNQEGVSPEEKLKQIDKVYKISRAKLVAKPNKNYIVSSRAGGTNPTKNRNKGAKQVTVRVDTRQKADKRGERRAEWRRKNKRGKK